MGDNQKILVLDDEPNIRETLGAYLDDCGYSVLSVESGEEALLALNEVCVAIVDIRLKGMDGLTFIQKAHALRRIFIFRCIPVPQNSSWAMNCATWA